MKFRSIIKLARRNRRPVWLFKWSGDGQWVGREKKRKVLEEG